MQGVKTSSPLPRHVAIIMDGNGRWASQRNLPRSEGHKAGAQTVRKTVSAIRKLGIEYLTLYAFSSENWKRPAGEIATLFALLLDFLNKETQLLVEQEIALKVIGNLDGLPSPQKIALRHAVNKTANGSRMTLNLALNYGSRAEIVGAVRNLMAQNIKPEEVTEEVFANYLYTANQPDPDLVIRTSGELRLSNFLLFQSAYSEFFFSPVYWPDFDEKELGKALKEYALRIRRFGQIGQEN